MSYQPRYERYPRLMDIGVLPQADKESERIFTILESLDLDNITIVVGDWGGAIGRNRGVPGYRFLRKMRGGGIPYNQNLSPKV